MDLIVHESRAEQAEAVAVAVAEELIAAVAARGAAAVAVPGGSSPGAFLAALAVAPVDWDAVTVMATDERWVSPDDGRSNEGMIRKAMAAAPIRFLPFWREGATAAEAARAASDQVAAIAPLTSVVLGMGADMHCASLFPGGEGLADGLDPSCASFALPIAAPGAPEPRITLTMPALAGAGSVRLLISGEEKREALDRALTATDPLAAPVSAVLRRARRVEAHWAP